jgi:hypothetical protein
MNLEFLAKGASFFGKEAFKLIVKLVKNNDNKLRVSSKNVEEALVLHFNKITKFCEEISFRELSKPKPFHSVYVHLDLSLEISSKIIERSKVKKKLETASILIEKTFQSSTNNIIIIGALGTGKTTTLKFVCQKLITDENYLRNISQYPILVRFRESELLINPEIPLFEYLLNIYGIVIENGQSNSDDKEAKNQLDKFKKQAVLTLLNHQNPLLLLDGIDEVSIEGIKNRVLSDIQEIAFSAPNVRFVLTSRKGDDDFFISNCQQFEIAPLSERQIEQFARQWLGTKKSISFLKNLKKSSVYDAATRPLALSHLCTIYEREGKIPEKTKSIYRKIVSLLILEWNLENEIHKESKFSDFDPDRKKEFIENLAFELSANFNKYQFNSTDLEKCYNNIYQKFGLPLGQMKKVIKEIQVHNGLVIQSGYDLYEFAHKSFQEFLAAEYLVKLPQLPVSVSILNIPNELAVAIALSSEPTTYLCYLISELSKLPECNTNFVKILFNRINIEKPDFIESTPMALSLLLLYNKLLEVCLKKHVKTEWELLNVDTIFQDVKENPHFNLSIKNLIKRDIYNTAEIKFEGLHYYTVYLDLKENLPIPSFSHTEKDTLVISHDLLKALTKQ